ncbi:nucleoside diphosphate kinase isoform X1 [Cygnus olor]|nr:nucleoside diphosphate kinase isoform X1 [Cygnus olor]
MPSVRRCLPSVQFTAPCSCQLGSVPLGRESWGRRGSGNFEGLRGQLWRRPGASSWHSEAPPAASVPGGRPGAEATRPPRSPAASRLLLSGPARPPSLSGQGLAAAGGRRRRAPSPAGPAPKRRGAAVWRGGAARPPPPPLPAAAAEREAAESAMAANCERTFIAIKPDGVQRGLVGEIIKRFEQKGFRLVAMKFVHASEDLLKQHYIDLKDRPFYPGLVKYMNSGPIVAMVWEGLNVVKTGRVMLGETNPADSKPGTIRGDFCIQVGRNIIHGSDSVESAQKEINLWFKPAELVDFKSCAHDWIYE